MIWGRPCQEIKQDLHFVKGKPVHTRKQSGNILGNLTVDLNMKGDRSTQNISIDIIDGSN